MINAALDSLSNCKIKSDKILIDHSNTLLILAN